MNISLRNQCLADFALKKLKTVIPPVEYFRDHVAMLNNIERVPDLF